MKKIKNSRSFTFKAYAISVDENSLNNIREFVINTKLANANKHFGSFVFKSDCEYYVEKNILDSINVAEDKLKDSNIYLIYKISTIEDSNVDDLLVMAIYFDRNQNIVVLD